MNTFLKLINLIKPKFMKKITQIISIILLCSFSAFTQTGWNKLTISETSAFKSVCFVSQNCGYVAAANGAIYRTYDGGDTWSLKNTGITGSINSIFFIDENNGWACGYPSSVYRTADAGESWTEGNCSSLLLNFKSIFFTSLLTGYVVGQEGYLYKTTDGGLNWSAYNSQTTESLTSVFFTNANNGYAVGEFGTIVRTTDGGENWTLCQNVPYGMFSDVWFADEYTGYAVSEGGGIIKTTDGGSTWSELTISGQYSFHSVCFKSVNTGFAVSDFGRILKTTDGGQYWFETTSDTTNHLYSIFFLNNNYGFVVGDNGSIYKTTSCAETPYLSLSSNNITLEGTDNSVGEFDIDGNTTWFAMEGVDWLSISPENGVNNSTITITATANTFNYPRQAFITIYGGYVNYQTVLVTQNEVTNINELPPYDFSIYPNPTNEELYVKYDIANEKNIDIVIYDVFGSKILSKESVNVKEGSESKINVSSLNQGVYFVKIKTDKGVGIQKFIINK